MILLNGKWKAKTRILLACDGAHVITCKFNRGGQDKLTMFPPLSTNIHIFNT